MALSVQLPPELECRLTQAADQQGLPAEDYMMRLLDQHLPPVDQQEALVNLLQAWTGDLKDTDLASGDDELLRALDADRLSERSLFPPELKGVTW